MLVLKLNWIGETKSKPNYNVSATCYIIEITVVKRRKNEECPTKNLIWEEQGQNSWLEKGLLSEKC